MVVLSEPLKPLQLEGVVAADGGEAVGQGERAGEATAVIEGGCRWR